MKYSFLSILLITIFSCSSNTTTEEEDVAQELTVDEMLFRDSVRADSMKAALLQMEDETDEEIPAD